MSQQEDEIFDDLEKRYSEGNYSMLNWKEDMSFLFHYGHLKRGDYRKPNSEPKLLDCEPEQQEVPETVKKAIRGDNTK